MLPEHSPEGRLKEMSGGVVARGGRTIVIGNAHGVRLRYNESDVDLLPFTRTDVARLKLE